MNINLPMHQPSPSQRNRDSRNYFTNGYTPPSSTEAINGPVREPNVAPAPVNDRLIVGVDFGTTFSGSVLSYPSLPLSLSFIPLPCFPSHL